MVGTTPPSFARQGCDLICTVPCVVHSDAGPCTKAKSTNCVSWSALLGSGGEKSSKFLVCSCVKTDSRGDWPSWERLLQDFAQLATSVVGGQEVARNKRRLWRFVLLTAKADEEVRCNEWGLPHFGAAENCSDCLCNKSTAPTQTCKPLRLGGRQRTWITRDGLLESVNLSTPS